jgi:hypothetical protein
MKSIGLLTCTLSNILSLSIRTIFSPYFVIIWLSIKTGYSSPAIVMSSYWWLLPLKCVAIWNAVDLSVKVCCLPCMHCFLQKSQLIYAINAVTSSARKITQYNHNPSQDCWFKTTRCLDHDCTHNWCLKSEHFFKLPTISTNHKSICIILTEIFLQKIFFKQLPCRVLTFMSFTFLKNDMGV